MIGVGESVGMSDRFVAIEGNRVRVELQSFRSMSMSSGIRYNRKI